MANVLLGDLLHLGEDERRYFLHGVFAVAREDPDVAVGSLHQLVRHGLDGARHLLGLEEPPYQALRREDGVP